MKDKKRAKIGEKEGITEFPKVVVYGAEDSKDKQNFDGPLAMAELKAFLEPHALSLEKREEIRKVCIPTQSLIFSPKLKFAAFVVGSR